MAISQSTSLAPFTWQPSIPSGPPSPEELNKTSNSLMAAPQLSREFKTRHLTISDVSLANDVAPFIRLRGKWLAQAGFNIGDPIQVTVTPQRLVIEVKAREVDPNIQVKAEQRAAAREAALHDLAAVSIAHPTPGRTQAVGDKPGWVPRRNIRRIPQTGGEWPQRIGPALEPALGDVLGAESSRLKLNPEGVASLAGVDWRRYRAFARGRDQPNLSTFVAIAWVLNQDPRELIDKVLLQMGLPPGTRPVMPPWRA